jgi:hypothetical protein
MNFMNFFYDEVRALDDETRLRIASDAAFTLSGLPLCDLFKAEIKK